jgi:transposase
MKSNTTIPLGAIVMLKKVENHFGLFHSLFNDVKGKAKDFVPLTKLLTCNKLTHSVSINQMNNTYPLEFMQQLGTKDVPSNRSMYRTLERIGKSFPIILGRYQQLIKKYKLVYKQQIIDFSSTYFEGAKSELAHFGYSRDKLPGKLQITFGISTGLTGIPSAITIQKGNVQDKKHMKLMIKIVSKVLPEGSLLIFDTGANTKKNKQRIRGHKFHYLTLRAKKVGPYKKYINFFNTQLEKDNITHMMVNNRHYSCVRKEETDGNTSYVFFSPELYSDQIKAKERKFKRQKEKGNKTLKKRKHTILPSEKGWVTLLPHLQKTLSPIENPYVNGVEGFFILESSVDDDSEKILRLYKQRDKAEKFIRALKEGIELRPIRHWNKWSVIGILFISFLANLLINLTHVLSKNSPVKNVKLLKKHLINLTLTYVYPENRFRFTVLSNVSPEILELFGDFVWKYRDKTLNLRW